MKISIITPCLNSEAFILDTIDSVIKQHGDFLIEYIIVDGASTDRTLDLCQQRVDKIKSGRFEKNCKEISAYLISELDTGMYDALVKGLTHASGDIIAYINSDDFYQPGAFSCIAELFEALPQLNWVSGAPSFYNDVGTIIGVDWPFYYDNRFIRQGLYNNHALPYIQQESIFFRRHLLEQLDLIELSRFRLAGDAFLWYGLAEITPLYSLQAILSGYRMHSHNMGNTAAIGYCEEMTKISKTEGLSDEEANHLLFVHFMWWRESKAAKELNNRRIIPWDTNQHRWHTEHLSYSLDYRPKITETYLSFLRQHQAGFAVEYVHNHLLK